MDSCIALTWLAAYGAGCQSPARTDRCGCEQSSGEEGSRRVYLVMLGVCPVPGAVLVQKVVEPEFCSMGGEIMAQIGVSITS